MICEFCGNSFANKRNLSVHQRNTKYCLKIQGKKIDTSDYKYECKGCNKKYRLRQDYRRHMLSCKVEKNIIKMGYENKIKELEQKNILLKKENEILIKENRELKSKYHELSLVAVKRPTSTTSNKTIQINNYIKQMEPLRIDRIKENVPMLTLDHHVKGPEGYAEYALEFPFKDRIVCVDVARNKIKYKNEEGDIVEDPGFRKMMLKLCDALKDRSYKLCQDHYEKLLDKFSEEEMDNTDFDFMEAAKAIHKYANGRESDFCSKIIKLISKGSKVN